MKPQHTALSISLGAIVLALCAHLSEGTSSSAIESDSVKGEIYILAKLLGPIRQLTNRLEDIEAIIERAATDHEFAMEVAKRQGGAWDMDYGWGGGRFGKRDSNKRYDAFGLGGRFGRSVDHVDVEKNN